MSIVRGATLALVLLFSASWGLAAQDAAPLAGPEEGIQVHGDWVVEVIRDGEVVSRNEFSNDLTTYGAGQLAALLSGSAVGGRWQVNAISRGSASEPLCESETSTSACRITEPGAAVGSPTLTVTVIGPDSDRLQLEGTTTAAIDFEITSVTTLLSTCPGSSTADACGGNTGGFFTTTSLPSPSPVVSGDQIRVTVVISFG
jgi:hypothetical protein